MRPRANTISHVDNATLGMIAAANSSAARHNAMELNLGHIQQQSGNGLPGVGGYHFRGMSTAAGHHGNPHVLPKLDTNNFNVDVGSSLRTAPPYACHAEDSNIDDVWYGQGNTINPAQLHFSHSPQTLNFDSAGSPYHQTFAGMPQAQATIDENGTFTWLNGFENQLSFDNLNEQAMDGSSPSAISTGSRSGLSELMLDGSGNNMPNTSIWQSSAITQTPMVSGYSMDISTPPFPEVFQPSQLSPKSMHAQISSNEQFFSSPPPVPSHTPIPMMHNGLPNQYFHPPMVTQGETPSNSAASVSSSSNRQSSVTSISTDSITDATRQALLTSLSQPSSFGHNHLKTSQPPVSSPLSPGFIPRQQGMNHVSLPSTYDLQRYVAAYIKYFHPHLPFLHIPSLSFDSPEITNNQRISSPIANLNQPSIAGGRGALVLAMAAIGAFYEHETGPSKELFEMAKKMIQLYLEERRKTEINVGAGAARSHESSYHNTPLWLVQAMLLNVVYGHNCGDKTSAGIASTHCAALVSLARSAGLMPNVLPSDELSPPPHQPNSSDIQMGGDDAGPEVWRTQQPHSSIDIHGEWQNWRLAEERKRTLYAIFILSSLLVSAYNHAPALMNSEIVIGLPCEEELWTAETADVWNTLGGIRIAEHNSLSFPFALSSLLTANQRHPHSPSHHFDQPFGSGLNAEDLPQSQLRPSTFGCLILINALHNYIWEMRQRHGSRPWTSQEDEAMHSHIEPALKAWQAAWANNPQHSNERPNPHGTGSLSADCIPLLDLAYIRLFADLGKSKEAFFQRDWEGMAVELAYGSDIVQHAELSPAVSDDSAAVSSTDHTSPPFETIAKAEQADMSVSMTQDTTQCSKRELQLRKAASRAANSLAMSDKLGVTFADFDSRELPLQSALCAFDCAQILAEWVASVQQRVGRYLGIIGKDEVDFSQATAIALLTDEDCKLFQKINSILNSAEVKLADSRTISATAALSSATGIPCMTDNGYGGRILLVTASMLERAAVWPITREMAQSLETQAIHVSKRATSSILSSHQA